MQTKISYAISIASWSLSISCGGVAQRGFSQLRYRSGSTAGENRADFDIIEDDGGIFDVISLSRHCCCSLRHLARAVPGETLDLALLDQTMTMPSVPFFLLGASF